MAYYDDMMRDYAHLVDFSTPLRCAAKSKRSGERCRAVAARGKNKCHMHAGLPPMGKKINDYQRLSKPLPSFYRIDERKKAQRIWRIKYFLSTGIGGHGCTNWNKEFE